MFEDAAKEFQVPVELLKAVAYVETRVSSDESVASAFGGHGIMALVGRDDWDTLSRAQALTGLSRDVLSTQARANIRGAAAVLREFADKSFREYPQLDSREVGDWFHAVSLYPGYDSAPAAMAYAADVFGRIERGYSVRVADGNVVLAATAPLWRKHAPVEQATQGLGDYPGNAVYRQSPNYSSGRSSYTYVLIHTMQGSYSGGVSWLTNPSSKVSSHYAVRSSDGQITQMVQHSNTAWHAQCYNGKSVGIEHEGFVADPGKWYTDAMYRESAKLTRWIADRHGIPKDRSRIIGHFEVAKSCNTGGHTDPGSGWNWTKYMQMVNGTTTPVNPGAGKFIGVIFQGGNTANRIAGATVTLSPGGQVATTDATGVFEVVVFPGAYTLKATKAGFSTATVAKTAAGGVDTWASMEINPSAGTGSTGKLYGKVYKHNAANPADTSAIIPGAVATIAGQPPVTAGADGMYRFEALPVGTFTVKVTSNGYAAGSLARTTVAGQTTWGSLGLTASGGGPTPEPVDTQAPSLAITFPAKDAQLDLAAITVTGNASDGEGTVSKVKLFLNGASAGDFDVVAGTFSADLLLKPGTNTLKVTAVDASGNQGTYEQDVTFNAGVTGFVHVMDDQASRVKSATVELQEIGTGTVVSSATTDATGAFSLAVATVPSDYVVMVKADGFVTSAQTLTIPAERRLSLNVALTPGENGGVVGLEFTSPSDGATVYTERLRLFGQVEGFTVKTVVVNGQPAELMNEGAFTILVPIKDGANVIEALATGVGGETVSARMTVNRTAGMVKSLLGTTGEAPATGGCAAVPTESLAALALLAAALRRRRLP